jgi:flavin-dependent dehydrogenase
VKSRVGIVGCSINGSYLAWKLSKENEVTVLEKNKVIGEKPCSGLVSERIWNFIPKNEKLIENVIDEAIVHFPKKNIELKFHPRMLVMNRKLLDQYVSKLAMESGANILLNNEVKKVYFFKNKKPQILADKLYEFDYLIGCDGFNSIVRKALNIKDPKFKLGIYTNINKKNRTNAVNVYPSKNGFGWIIPRNSNTEYGFLENANKAKYSFDRFCKSRKIKPQKIYSHVIPEGLVKAGEGRVALCGDAIGLTKPISGGGIVWGLTACDILLKNFPNFIRYDNDIKRFFEPKIFYSRIALSSGKFFSDKISFLIPKEIWFDSDMLF